jgi:hypothetical protein
MGGRSSSGLPRQTLTALAKSAERPLELMRRRAELALAFAVALLLLLVPAVLLLRGEHREPANEQKVLLQYLKALYARDFKQAYRFISSPDRELKTEEAYVSEQGSFSGFTSEVAQILARWIEARPIGERSDGDRVHVRMDLTLPDANAVSPWVLNWDEEKLNAVSRADQKKIVAALQQLKRSGNLKMIRGDEEFVLVKEGSGWKVFLDWAAGVRVTFGAIIPEGVSMSAEPALRETIVHPGDLFSVDYRVANHSGRDLAARIVHHVEPKTLADHLDVVECALLFPVRLPAHREQTYTSRYLLQSDLPEGAKEIKVVYEFQVER